MAWTLACLGLLAALVGAQASLLGLARDFVFDITAANKDRIVFSSMGSGVQAFTYFSEGDLTDSLGFYLYGLWTYDGQTVPPNDLRVTLLKTRDGLPIERYNATTLLQPLASSDTRTNILSALAQQCETLLDLVTYLQSDQLAVAPSFPDIMPARLVPFLPRFPAFFEELLARTLLPFRANMEDLPQVASLTGIGRQTTKPADFHFTWQKSVDDAKETVSVVYGRGSFKLSAEVGTATLLDIFLSN